MAATDLVRARLGDGLVIPACPLALTPERRFDERRQRALLRYYRAAGAGGIAVGVHTTQFAIHNPVVGLLRPLWELTSAELGRAGSGGGLLPLGIAGICGDTRQAVGEAGLARDLGFAAGLLSLAALGQSPESKLLDHCRAVAAELPLVGFYLQPAVGGRLLPFRFWREFAAIENVVAIKIAPFNRYQTLDVVRAVAESGREDIALYTGNDDTIVPDLLTPFRFRVNGREVERRIVGGLLGHWSVWTQQAVQLHRECRRLVLTHAPIPAELLRLGAEITDANGAFFDAANGFAGCLPGIHEVLKRQGLLTGTECLDPQETLSPGQGAEIERVLAAYPHLADDEFVHTHLDRWLS